MNDHFTSGPRQRVFSGFKPTGDIHLGNYVGAVRHWVEQQDSYDAFYCVVDLHAMTVPWEPRLLRARTLHAVAMLMACGIDPERSVLFVQSHVAAHSELAWVLTCLARMGELRRMVQFKEKSRGEAESVGVGLFTYPVLQAADVLLYGAHGVPVGDDQRQHVELMRDLATRFNTTLGDTFVVPEAWIPPSGARIMALDDPTQKMSASFAEARPGSALFLADSPAAIAKKVRSAVTDSGRDVVSGPDKPALSNLLTVFSVVADTSVEELEERFSGSGYAQFKQALADAIIERFTPIRVRYEQLLRNQEEMSEVLSLGAEKASEVADATLSVVRDRIGLARAAGSKTLVPGS